MAQQRRPLRSVARMRSWFHLYLSTAGATVFNGSIETSAAHPRHQTPLRKSFTAAEEETRETDVLTARNPQHLRQPQQPRRRRRKVLFSSACEVDSFGNYGQLEQTTPRYVSYYYQAVFSNGTSQDDVETYFLPSAQRIIVNGILSKLFECSTIEPLTDILGISSSFEDRVASCEFPIRKHVCCTTIDCFLTFCICSLTDAVPCLLEMEQKECFTFEGRRLVWATAIPDSAMAEGIVRPLVHEFISYHHDQLLALYNRTLQIEYMEEENGQLSWPPPLVQPSNSPTMAPSSPSPSTTRPTPPSPAPLGPPPLFPVPSFSPTSVLNAVTRDDNTTIPSAATNTSNSQPSNETSQSNETINGNDGDDPSPGFWWLWLLIVIGVIAIGGCCFSLVWFNLSRIIMMLSATKTNRRSDSVDEDPSSFRPVRSRKKQSKMDESLRESRSREYVPPAESTLTEIRQNLHPRDFPWKMRNRNLEETRLF